jgi:hypothetical protein
MASKIEYPKKCDACTSEELSHKTEYGDPDWYSGFFPTVSTITCRFCGKELYRNEHSSPPWTFDPIPDYDDGGYIEW